MDDDQDVIISTINLAEIYQVALHSFDEFWMDSYIAKPVKIEELRAVLESCQ